ncbi:MAG: formylmethanofuran dehydrogenase subunit E family protein [Candidatus Bathyarchaeia archaeon]|nr:formylmethanofuran dehydrogenase subunit E family protein [Candidatus Bathyarchaeota archaeon]
MLSKFGDTVSPELLRMLRKARDFHGHMGPFLVIGVRAGLTGLQRLNVERGDISLHATVWLKYSTPFSCVADGVQVSTGCTYGNKRLTVKDSDGIMVRVENHDGQVNIALRGETLNDLKMQVLSRNLCDSELERLAYGVATVDESKLFIIQSGAYTMPINSQRAIYS